MKRTYFTKRETLIPCFYLRCARSMAPPKKQLFIREEFSLELAVDKLYTRTECWIARSMALDSLKLKNYINPPRQIRKKKKKIKTKENTLL